MSPCNTFDKYFLSDFKNSVPKNVCLLGLDTGEKRIGVAVSDASFMIASPLGTVAGTKDVFPDLLKLFQGRKIGGIVAGLPLQMDGTEGEQASFARKQAEKIADRLELPLLMWDERLSSSAVDRFLREEAGLSGKKKKGVLDKNAAAFILQGALDALSKIP